MQPTELLSTIQERFGDVIQNIVLAYDELTIELAPSDLLETCTALRDEQVFKFEQAVDVCGVDYSAYGNTEWATEESTNTGFSRGVAATAGARLPVLEEELSVAEPAEAGRFAAVYHLLSVKHNHRLRIRVFAPDDQLPIIPSVIDIWNGVNWFEREAFDLFGIMFEGHPDLRRILTDYGFIGHPFRKDFPLSGNVEVRYDAEKGRVIYQPVTIEPRVLVPRVIRAQADEHGHEDDSQTVVADEAKASDKATTEDAEK